MKMLKKLLPVLLVTVVLYLFLFCGADSRKIKISDNELPVMSEVTDESIFVSNAKRKEMKKVASSGMLDMYLDEKTMAVCIYDAISGKLYRSLPEKYVSGNTSALSADVLIDGREYTLTSQRDSAAFDCIEYEQTDDGLTIIYNFRKSLDSKNKLDISVPVSYVLTDGMLTVSVECDKIYCGGKTVITGLSVLDFFGAESDGSKGDYILLPQGSGAVLDLAEKAQSFEGVSLRVYGNDPATDKETGSDVLVGAFGRKYADRAFVCLVSEGEALCEITADKALEDSGYNRVGACFVITPTSQEDKYVRVSNESYKGEIRLCYRFLNGESADYTGMASAVRELLIRQGRLSEKGIDKDREYPFNLTLVMSEEALNEKNEAAVRILTSFNQAYELISSLKSKGLTNIDVRLKGIYEKDRVKLLGDLGTEKELELMTGLSDDGSVRFYASDSLSVAGKPEVTAIDNSKITASDTRAINKKLASYISSLRAEKFGGICVNYEGTALSSTFAKRSTYLREYVKNSLSEILSKISASKLLMVEKGNLYTVKYADSIVELPSSSSLSQREYFSDVPFVQTILHGIVDYSHEAVNISPDSKIAMLRAAEYGALPHYEWYCTWEENDEDAQQYYYMNTISSAKAYYDKMKSDFSLFRSRRITAHEQVKKDVYLTRFGEDCTVYVNYSDAAVSVGGVTVDAKSYAVVN